MQKQTKEQKILSLLAKGKDIKEIAKQVRVKPAYVYYVRWKDQNKTKPKKKAQFKSPRSRLINDLFQIKKAVDEVEKKTTTDLVNHPPHYKSGGIETIDFIEAKDLNYRLGNVVKYVSRAEKKGEPLQDLKKARWYLDREIATRERA